MLFEIFYYVNQVFGICILISGLKMCVRSDYHGRVLDDRGYAYGCDGASAHDAYALIRSAERQKDSYQLPQSKCLLWGIFKTRLFIRGAPVARV